VIQLLLAKDMSENLKKDKVLKFILKTLRILRIIEMSLSQVCKT